MKMADELVIAHMLAARRDVPGEPLLLCALEALRTPELGQDIVTVAHKLFGMTMVEVWGVAAGWDDLRWPERAPHWRHNIKGKDAQFARGYAIGHAAYLACKT